MGRPKGSRNRAKDRPVVGNPIPTEQEGTANVEEQPNTASPSDALASPETLAPGDATQGGPTPAAPVVGMRIHHADGDDGTITVVEPRGDGFAVSVKWDVEESESQYTPIDWQDIGARSEVIAAENKAITEPAPATEVLDEPKPFEATYDADDDPLPPPGIGTRLAEIGHEWADTDAQLVAKEAEKSTVVKQYTKEIDILESRCRQLAAEYREAEWPETFDYKRGLKFVWNGRTGRIARTEKLGSYQAPLNFDKPSKPPTPATSEQVSETPAEPTEPVAEVLEHPVFEGPAEPVESTPFDEPSEETAEA